jgi:hypothetical protein
MTTLKMALDRAKSALGSGTKLHAITSGSATAQQLRWCGLGDSIADFKMRFLYGPLDRAYGGGTPGASISTGSSGTGWSIIGITNNGDTGTVNSRLADFDAWFSGLTQHFTTGATRTYGIAGVSAYWDTAKVYYVTGNTAQDGGTFKIQVEGVDETGFTSVATTAGTVGMGIATITKGSVLQRALKVVNLTGNIRIIGVAFTNSTNGGLIYSSVSQGGLPLDSAVSTATGRANLSAYLTDFNPNIVSLECKESSTYMAAAVATLFDLIKTAVPNATVIAVGTTPISSNDADQVIQNTQLKAAADSRGFIYWDGYTPVKDYATLNALGWAGDGTHVDDKANAFLSGLMAEDLNLLTPFGLTAGRDFNAGAGRVRNRLNLGGIDQVGGGKSNAAFSTVGNSGLDLDLFLKRTMRVTSEGVGLNGSSWVFQPDNAQDQQIPFGTRVGTTGPYLQAYGSILQVSSARGGGTLLDLKARALVQGYVNVGAVSGAVTLDLSTGSIFSLDLTGNITSLTFSNPGTTGQTIEVHFIQDATGSRTLAGVNGAIKFAGGSLVLTTTASKRDVLTFTYTGQYVETSRSMSVG